MEAEFLKDKTGGVVAAFSGGSDSLGMLVLLVQALGPADLAAVYVDHGIRSRDEIEAEISLNRENCRRLGVRFEVRRLAPLKSPAFGAEGGMENAARAMRYEALEEARDFLGFKWIATAHNKDDQAETVLMRLLSGKALVSLAGIPSVNGHVIRPVLDMSRAELEEVCRKAGLRWSVDSTNAQNQYLRNKIRHRLMPEIGNIFPAYREALGVFAQEIRTLGEDRISQADVEGGLEIACFKGLPAMLRNVLLHRFWSLALSGCFVSLSRGLARRILAAVDEGRAAYIVSGGVVAEVFGGRLFIRCEKAAKPFRVELDLRLDGERIPLPGGRTLTRGTQVDACRIDEESLYVLARTIKGKAVVRNARQGDAIVLEGGRKLVSDLLREMGVPRSRRPFVPLLADDEKIIAVLGRAYGGRDRICRKCRTNLAPNVLSLYIVE